MVQNEALCLLLRNAVVPTEFAEIKLALQLRNKWLVCKRCREALRENLELEAELGLDDLADVLQDWVRRTETVSAENIGEQRFAPP